MATALLVRQHVPQTHRTFPHNNQFFFSRRARLITFPQLRYKGIFFFFFQSFLLLFLSTGRHTSGYIVSVSRQKIRQSRTQDVKQTHHERANGPPREVVMKRRNIKHQEIKNPNYKTNTPFANKSKNKNRRFGVFFTPGYIQPGYLHADSKTGNLTERSDGTGVS
jgi:hypothetical protein